MKSSSAMNMQAPMKASRPAAAIPSGILASLLALLLAGCGNFWQNPYGTSTGTTSDTVTLTLEESSITAGSSDTLTATISSSSATGTVTFYSDGSSLGSGVTVSSGSASATYTFSNEGTYELTADYSGDDTYEASDSSEVELQVTDASSSSSSVSVPDALASRAATGTTNLVLDPSQALPVTATAHLHDVAVVMLNGDKVQNIDGDGHCVFYSGKVYFANSSQTSPGSSDSKGVYELSGGGYLAPEGTKDLDCE